MLAKHAWYFFALRELLNSLHRRLGLPLPSAFAPSEVGGAFTGLGSLGNSLRALQRSDIGNPFSLGLSVPSPPPPAPTTLTENERDDIKSILGLLENMCRSIEIISISKDIGRATSDSGLLFVDRARMQFHVEHITARISDELQQQNFLHISSDKVEYYSQLDLFGEEVGKKFPKTAEDLTNAGSAYALGLNTACVFHLMRAMEHCVQRFGRKLRVTIDVKNESWANIMDHVNNQVKALPAGKRHTKAQNTRKQKYALAADRLDHVRLVWRNDVMHPKATYDEQEAFDVLTSVKAFLESLVKLV